MSYFIDWLVAHYVEVLLFVVVVRLIQLEKNIISNPIQFNDVMVSDDYIVWKAIRDVTGFICTSDDVNQIVMSVDEYRKKVRQRELEQGGRYLKSVRQQTDDCD